jgi:hypothetical protein
MTIKELLETYGKRTYKVTKAEAHRILQTLSSLPGPAFFGVQFVKRTTGEIRDMTASFRIKAGVNGKGLKFDPSQHRLMTVHDMQLASQGFEPKACKRMINLDTLQRVKFQGREFIVSE